MMVNGTFYAQFGEDQILNKIFKNKKGNCVEVGGFDGVTGSNTYFFEKIGWKCLIVEPMPDYCDRIRKTRSCDVAQVAASDKAGEVEFCVATGVETLSTMEKNDEHFARIKSLSNQEIQKITVKTQRLDDILEERGMTQIDFMTIDVEGHEMSVLSGMAFKSIHPRILIIEDNSRGMNKQVVNFMRSKSYVRFRKTGCNDWYASREDSLVTIPARVVTEVRILLEIARQKIKPLIPQCLRSTIRRVG